MTNSPVVVERTYVVPAEKVWQAITDNSQMKQWYFRLPEFRPEPGFEFIFKGGPPEGPVFVHLCQVTEVIPNKKLAHTWRYEGYPGDTTVTWELFDMGDKTTLRLTHSGLESFPEDVPSLAKHNFAEGWTSILGTGLKDWLERGSN